MSIIPNPPIDPRQNITETTTQEDRSRHTRLVAVFGLATAIAVGGVFGPAVASSAHPDHQTAPVQTAPVVRSAQVDAAETAPGTEVDLGDVTLDELAVELADLGLTLRVEPTAEEGDGGQPAVEQGDVADPFEGMTDEEVDALSDEEFFDLLDEAGIDYEEVDGDGFEEESGDFSEEEEVLGAFAIDGDEIDLSDGPNPEVSAQAQEIWERFVKLIPANQRQMVVSFELNPEEAGGAYVYPSEEDPSNWVLGVSLGLGEDLDYVLIHEFAHLLTLQASEVPPAADADTGSCPTYFTGEGCALSGTTMAEFVQKFWPQEQLDEIAALHQAEDYDGIDAFYEAHQDDFVTDYATTNPAEDLAETFTYFVLNDRPTGETIADQKVNVLWNDPDMVALRGEILANR